MSNLFVLEIETDPTENQATLRLHNQQEATFGGPTSADWE